MEKCTLHTDDGGLVLYDREATQVAAVVERLLRMHWRRLQHAERLPGAMGTARTAGAKMIRTSLA